MRMAEKVVPLFCSLFLLLSLNLIADVVTDGQQDPPVQALLDAVRQAVRPAHNMRVEWSISTPNPTGWTRESIPSESGPPYTEIEYEATLSGVRSRIESLHKSYQAEGQSEPYHIDQTVAVFDGTKQLKLQDRIKGEGRKLVGWQFLRDKNSSLVADILFDWPIDLNNQKLIQNYTFQLLESPGPGLYLLEIIKDNGSIYHWTIDGNRGFNTIKIERFRSPGDKDYEIRTGLEEYVDGLWYPATREKIRYPLPGEGGQPHVEEKVQVKSAEFNIEIPDETFVLEFPPMTRVWDDILQGWFVVGDVEPISTIGLEQLSDPYARKNVQAEGTTGVPEPQPAAVEQSASESIEKGQVLPGDMTGDPKRHYVLWWSLAAVLFITASLAILRSARSGEKK